MNYKPKILFLLKALETGGLEVVTAVLANKFAAEGHEVYVFAFMEGKNSIAKRFDAKVNLELGHGYKADKENIKQLRKVLIAHRIDVIVNQWGLPLVPIQTAKKAARGLNVKIISVYHNAPSYNGRTQSIDIKLMGCENPLKRLTLKVQRWLYKKVTSRAMRYIYEKSDMFVVLSDCYREEFQRFTRIKHVGKLAMLTNPVTIDTMHYVYEKTRKQKEIIYVGRLDFVQKRVYRVIDTWNYLEDHFPEWRLTLVGDGEDKENLERHVKALGLKRVKFEGFRHPMDYYKRSSLLMLTSDFEGFPLVLAECMSFGVVPIVYHSYAAVTDIIDDGVDGLVIPYSADGFPSSMVAEIMKELMTNSTKLNNMAEAAIRKSKLYGIDEIYKRWMVLFDHLLTKANV